MLVVTTGLRSPRPSVPRPLAEACRAAADLHAGAHGEPAVDPHVPAALAVLLDVEERLLTPPGREADLGALVERLRGERMERPRGTLAARIASVVEDRHFAEVAAAAAVHRGTVDLVSGLGARWTLACDDEAAPCALMAAHAVRALGPFLVDKQAADLALARFALACFVAAGSPGRADARGLPRAEDEELLRAASHDEKIARLIAVCLDEERAARDAIYRILATRVARRRQL